MLLKNSFEKNARAFPSQYGVNRQKSNYRRPYRRRIKIN